MFPPGMAIALNAERFSMHGLLIWNVTQGELPMLAREHIELVLQRTQPFMRPERDGIGLLEAGQHAAGARSTGVCTGCKSARMRLSVGVECERFTPPCLISQQSFSATPQLPP
jgi:hypothetical protein